MKLLVVLFLIILGLMAIRRSLVRFMHPGPPPSPRDRRHHARDEARKREGDVTIDTSGTRKGNSGADGDYVDYEELK